MTAEIIHFTPKRELDAAANLAGFVDVCRNQLTAFGKQLDWDAFSWDVTAFVEGAARRRRGRIALVWSNYDTSKQGGGPAMVQPFLDFAKSYMRYQHSMRPTDNLGQRISALRALERALVEASIDEIPRVEQADAAVFNRAAELLQDKFSEGGAYKSAMQLQIIATFLQDHLLLGIPATWKNILQRQEDRNRVGKKFNEERTSKLPTKTALDALAAAFYQARQPNDIVITSIGAILASAPSRISEVLSLPCICEHATKHSNGDDAYGIRWWPAKGAEPMIKWVVSSMADVAKSALKKIREQTEEARRMARWYDEYPGELYLPDDLQHLRGREYLLPQELADILGIGRSGVDYWTEKNGCEKLPHPHNACRVQYRFSDVEAAVIRLLPKGFPVRVVETGLRYKDALFLVPKNFFHLQRPAYRCMFEVVTEDDLNIQLGGGSEHGKSSVFSRLGYTEADESPIKINTHMFRHWLDNLANGNGLSPLDIALWSGRKDIRQNAVYDHVTSDEFLARIRAIESDTLPGQTNEIMLNAPVSREEYLLMKFPTAHSTPFGFCVHDWSNLPCQRHADCLNCREHVCLKCDAGKTARIREALADAEVQLARAEEAVEDEYYGADRWLEHHRKTTKILRTLVALLDDSSVPNSSLFQLTIENEFSKIRAAIDDRRLLGDDDAKIIEMIPLLQDFTQTDKCAGTTA